MTDPVTAGVVAGEVAGAAGGASAGAASAGGAATEGAAGAAAGSAGAGEGGGQAATGGGSAQTSTGGQGAGSSPGGQRTGSRRPGGSRPGGQRHDSRRPRSGQMSPRLRPGSERGHARPDDDEDEEHEEPELDDALELPQFPGSRAAGRIEQAASKLVAVGVVVLVGFILCLLLLFLPIIAIESVLGISGGGGSTTSQIGPGTPIPLGYIPVFNAAAKALDVNPYLLASVADQESGFSSEGVNSSGCAGFMQMGVGGACGDSWGSSVTLTAHPHATVVASQAYTLGVRPGSYTGKTATHPNYNDPFDAVTAAAVWLRNKVGGAPIPNLDNTAYQALCGYYGACSGNGVDYAPEVYDRAKQWEAEGGSNPLVIPGTGVGATSPVGYPAGAMVQRLITIADEIDAGQYPYCYGGGHVDPAAPTHGTYCHNYDNQHIYGSPAVGLDCSGAVSMLLQHAGYHFATMASTGFETWGLPGPGKPNGVTIWANSVHVFIEIDGRDWGSTGAGHPYGGPAWGPEPTVGFIPRHLAGL